MDKMELLKAMREMMDDMKAERKVDKEEIVVEIKANQAWVEESLRGEIKLTVSAIKGKMEAIVHSIRSGQDGKIQRRSENVTERQEIPKEGAAVASLECKEHGPKEMESGAERQMVPKEEAAVKSSRVMKKQSRGQHIAAGRRVKPTKLT
jgi:di/tripeptidase